jgi:hypothetical protein
MSALLLEVRELLREAATRYTGTPHAARVDEIQRRIDEPLRVAFAGKVKAGKSTLLNALVGEELAPTDAGECTRIVTWYRNGHTYQVTLQPRGGAPRQVRFSRDDGALMIDLDGVDPDEVDHLEVMWPSSRLAETTLIDTPGLDSINTRTSEGTHRFLAIDDDEDTSQADAVIYLMRHLHQSDLGFLEAFRDDTFSGAGPVNTVAILSRADEVGACRPEAMQSARRIAARYRGDPRLRRLCQTVIPVAGLLAQGSATLTEGEFRALRTIAALPRPVSDGLMLSVDRFVGDADIDVTPLEREDLLARIGLYGVRLAIRFIRLGAADTSTELTVRLRELSGIDELRSLFASLFAARRDVLKARAAVAALDALLQDAPDERLELQLERLTSSAHELTEVHVLHAARAGGLQLTPAEMEEIERLLGVPGAAVADRLGVTAGEERVATLAAIDRWRRRAESPMSSRPVADAAHSIVRTLEGLLAVPEARSA